MQIQNHLSVMWHTQEHNKEAKKWLVANNTTVLESVYRMELAGNWRVGRILGTL